MKKGWTVADFFCGAGGFSEGFRQKGFDVVFALDNWKPAIETHKLNHPDCNAVLQDILALDTPEKIDSVVPDVDMIIGSPPCIAFSGSNKAGKADKSLGIRLIESYLRIILWKQSKGTLKRWILENVPNSGKYVKDEYSWEELGLPGKGPSLTIKQRAVLNAADYGAPQGRMRFFCGDFPLPEKTHNKKALTVAMVLHHLTNPLSKSRREITDPVYGFKIPRGNLTDHFYDSRVSEPEWKRARQLKEDHGFMGKMSFPEDIYRSSRTVMATMSASTRESMIFKSFDEKGKPNGYRLPTIREIACFMSFPVTYQFEAGSIGGKYRLVGNAVCAKMSAAVAEAIAKKEGLDVPEEFPQLLDARPSFNLNGHHMSIKPAKPRPVDAKFVRHIPYLKIRSFRIELNNLESDFKNGRPKWSCVLHQGGGKRALKAEVDSHQASNMLKRVEKSDDFISAVKKTFPKNLTASKLQEDYCKHEDSIGPVAMLEKIKEVVDGYFPEDEYSETVLDNSSKEIPIDKDYMPVRILAGLFACAHIVENIKP